MQLLREECISKLAEKYTSIHMPEIHLPEFDGDFVCKSNNYVIVKADSYTGDKRRINREFEVSGIEFYILSFIKFPLSFYNKTQKYFYIRLLYLLNCWHENCI